MRVRRSLTILATVLTVVSVTMAAPASAATSSWDPSTYTYRSTNEAISKIQAVRAAFNEAYSVYKKTGKSPTTPPVSGNWGNLLVPLDYAPSIITPVKGVMTTLDTRGINARWNTTEGKFYIETRVFGTKRYVKERKEQVVCQKVNGFWSCPVNIYPAHWEQKITTWSVTNGSKPPMSSSRWLEIKN